MIDLSKLNYKEAIAASKESIKILEESIPEMPITESFSSSKAELILVKLGKILTQRTGKKTMFIPGRLDYTNEYGKFASYLGMWGKNIMLRLNFSLNGTEFIYSLDLMGDINDMKRPVPEKTILFNGFNIIQVIDQIIDVLTGEFDRYDESIKTEAGSDWRPDFETWYAIAVNAASCDQAIRTGSYSDICDDFNTFAKSNVSVSLFQKHLAWYLKKIGKKRQASQVPAISVVPGVKTRSILVDPAIAQEFEMALQDDAVTKYEELRTCITGCVHMVPSFNGAILYGPPGHGKTTLVNDVCKENGVVPITIKIPVGGFGGLIKTLYENREKRVIIFDDNDALWRDPRCVNIMKNVLIHQRERIVGNGLDIMNLGGGNGSIPGEFEFNSSIVFCTNMKRTDFDPAILSRLKGRTFEVYYTPEEVFEILDKGLEKLDLDNDDLNDLATAEIRREVFEICTKTVSVAVEVTFRSFKQALIAYLAMIMVGNSQQVARRAVFKAWAG